MLRPDDVGLVELRLEIGDLEDLLRLFRQGDVADRERPARGADGVLDRFLQLVKIDAEVPKDFDRDSFPLAYHAEQKMLCPDIVVTQPECLLTAEADDILNAV